MTLNKRRGETEILEYPPDAIGSGNAVVASAGTAVQLSATSTPTKRVYITAKVGNTGTIWVGSSGVADGTEIPLTNLSSMTIDIDNLTKVYIDSDQSNDAVGYTYVV